jgi:hypothetical protein
MSSDSAVTVTTYFGDTIPGTLSGTVGGGITPHAWKADASGLFHTATNLAAEWQGFYIEMVNQIASQLSPIQWLEGNAEAVFENTGLASLDTVTQAVDREDVQRELDAIAGAMTKAGISGTSPLTTQDYMAIGRAMQSDPALEELAMQGHGLNNPSLCKYDGYTNDFQNSVDDTTLYIGGGLDNNDNALSTFFDDVVLSHLPFPVIAQDGQLEQLNQDGDAENTLSDATGALDTAMFSRVFVAADFSATAGTADSTTVAPPAATPNTTPNTMTGLFGDTVATKLTITNAVLGSVTHVWTADANGVYQTTTNLAAEWKGYYTLMLANKGGGLTAVQRLEGNAEAVFENTALCDPSFAAELPAWRADVQREFDAISAAMTKLGMNGHTALTASTYLQLEHALQDDPALLELAIQGHGLNDPSDSRYNGYTTDFQNGTDDYTLYVGGGLNSGQHAIAQFLDDNILTHLVFPTIAQDGEIQQLNQNGDAENTLAAAVDGLNQAMLARVYGPADFNIPGNPAPGSPAGTVTTVFGASIAPTITVNGHVWTAGADGRFHTTTNLTAEWKSYFATMQAGQGNTLTAVQRWEGNAEAVFEFTNLATKLAKPAYAAQAQGWREDAQRAFDAVATIMGQLGLGSTLLTTQNYLAIGNALQSNAALEELAIQGHGLNNQGLSKYCGYTGDFQNNSGSSPYYVGGGLNNGQRAVARFFDDSILSHLPFPTVAENGKLLVLNQDGNAENMLTAAVQALNNTLFIRVYVASDFSTNAAAVGGVVTVPGAPTTPPAAPVAGAGQMTTLTGNVISTSISGLPHAWTADAKGLFHTATDLTLEWNKLYQQALAGAKLTYVQQLEANAEAMFENTGLARESEHQQAIDREDIQREIDAIAGAMTKAGFDGTKPLSVQDYLTLGHVLQSNATLEELAIQGHGLNNPPSARYGGYTNDIQYSVDSRTLYVGGGVNTGDRAIAAFLDDSVLSHLCFPVAVIDGELEQLNQNGDAENTLPTAVAALDASMFTKTYKAADFLVPGRGPSVHAVPPGAATVTTLDGTIISGTIDNTLTAHSWVADANGQFHTNANLEIEWRTAYQTMLAAALAGQPDNLSPLQRLEGNAEAVFENTGIWNASPCQEANAREALQRTFDAINAAMRIDAKTLGISATATFTQHSYLMLQQTLQGPTQTSETLEELALQGEGQVVPVLPQYRGYAYNVQGWFDATTYYVGGGLDNGKLAVCSFLGDAILTQLPFASAMQCAQFVQFDQLGNPSLTVADEAAALNDAMFRRVYVAGDFSKSATATGPVLLAANASPAGAAPISYTANPGYVVTLDGTAIVNTQTVNSHVWTAGSDGLFHTGNLATEWTTLYQKALAGTTPLTGIQRLEANAEAVIEATSLKGLNSTAAGQAILQSYREDIQRQLDAMAGAMQVAAQNHLLDPTLPLTVHTYLVLQKTLMTNEALEELALQGHGIAYPSAAKYRGYSADIATSWDHTTYVGHGVGNGSSALGTFLADSILSNQPFATIFRGGKPQQLNQYAWIENSVAQAVTLFNQSMFGYVYKKTDFKA